MGAEPPAVAIRGQVPIVRDIRAREEGQDGEGQSPQGNKDDSEDTDTIRPRPLLKDAQVLEEQRQFDEYRGKRESPIEHIKGTEIVCDLSYCEEEEMLAGAIANSWWRRLVDGDASMLTAGRGG